ncbi:MAG: flagellar biosynthesis regulator FlaF [Gemmobacter sp.]|uniref:flagellar biosynthesis regulator FlaF n=1 Tax=Gemmobacter sp. TaxID=1898957 RepID=UPI00391C4057
MSTLNFARTAYARPEAPARTPRSIEYDLLARITQALGNAWQDRKQNFPALAAAISDNTRLWSTLAADVADPGNALPRPLRAQLFYLYQFSEQHGRKVLAGEASVEVLVDINTAVMRGLRGDQGASA